MGHSTCQVLRKMNIPGSTVSRVYQKDYHSAVAAYVCITVMTGGIWLELSVTKNHNSFLSTWEQISHRIPDTAPHLFSEIANWTPGDWQHVSWSTNRFGLEVRFVMQANKAMESLVEVPSWRGV